MPAISTPPSPLRPALVLLATGLLTLSATAAFATKTLRARAVADARVADDARDLLRRVRERARTLTAERAEALRERDAEARRRAETTVEEVRRRLAPAFEAETGTAAAAATPKSTADSAEALAPGPVRANGLLDQLERLRRARERGDADPALARLREEAAIALDAAPPGTHLVVYEDGLRRVYEGGAPPRSAATASRPLSFFDGQGLRQWTIYAAVPAPEEPRAYTAGELARRLDDLYGLERLARAGPGGGTVAWRLSLLDADERPAALDAGFPLMATAAATIAVNGDGDGGDDTDDGGGYGGGGDWPAPLRAAPDASRAGGGWRVERVAGDAAWITRVEHLPALAPCPWSFALAMAREEPSAARGWLLALAADPNWALLLTGLGLSTLGAAFWTAAVLRRRHRLSVAQAQRNTGAKNAAAPTVAAEAGTVPVPVAASYFAPPPGWGWGPLPEAAAKAPGFVRDPEVDPAHPGYVPPPGESLQRLQDGFRDAPAAPAAAQGDDEAKAGRPPKPRPLDAASNPLLRALVRRVRPQSGGRSGGKPDASSLSAAVLAAAVAPAMSAAPTASGKAPGGGRKAKADLMPIANPRAMATARALAAGPGTVVAADGAIATQVDLPPTRPLADYSDQEIIGKVAQDMMTRKKAGRRDRGPAAGEPPHV